VSRFRGTIILAFQSTNLRTPFKTFDIETKTRSKPNLLTIIEKRNDPDIKIIMAKSLGHLSKISDITTPVRKSALIELCSSNNASVKAVLTVAWRLTLSRFALVEGKSDWNEHHINFSSDQFSQTESSSVLPHLKFDGSKSAINFIKQFHSSLGLGVECDPGTTQQLHGGESYVFDNGKTESGEINEKVIILSCSLLSYSNNRLKKIKLLKTSSGRSRWR
jgi:hypothetical protein